MAIEKIAISSVSTKYEHTYVLHNIMYVRTNVAMLHCTTPYATYEHDNTLFHAQNFVIFMADNFCHTTTLKVNVHCMAHSNNKISSICSMQTVQTLGWCSPLPPPMYVCRHHLRRLNSDGRTSTLKLDKDCAPSPPIPTPNVHAGATPATVGGWQSQHTHPAMAKLHAHI